MRLQEIYSNCKRIHDEWQELEFLPVGNDTFVLRNSESIMRHVTSLSNIAYFKELVLPVIETLTIVEGRTRDGKYDHVTKYRMTEQYTVLKTRVETIVCFFESVGYQRERVGIDIKLPPEITLEGLSKCAKDLNTVFTTCPMLKSDEGSIEFREVDVGSIWLGFAIAGGAVAVLAALAAVVDKIVIIRSHWLTTKQQEESIRRMELSNDILENYIDVNTTIEEKMLEKASEDLAKEYNVVDPEEQLRLKHSLELLYDWQKKGMEIYPSISTPPEVKAVFPPLEMQALPNEALKLLEEHTKKKEE